MNKGTIIHKKLLIGGYINEEKKLEKMGFQ